MPQSGYNQPEPEIRVWQQRSEQPSGQLYQQHDACIRAQRSVHAGYRVNFTAARFVGIGERDRNGLRLCSDLHGERSYPRNR